MEKITVRSTSALSAVADDIILRETSVTRLVFRPTIIRNQRNDAAAVNGDFIFQRKTPNQEWIDHKELSLSQLKASEWIKLNLHSAEVLKLYEHLTYLYSIYQQEGIQFGERKYLRADEGLGALLDATENDLQELLNQEPEDASTLFSRMLQWVSNIDSPNKVVEKLELLDVSCLQQLNSIVGLTTLKASYSIWEQNKNNSNEEFWQTTLSKYSFVLSQVFAYPVIILQGKAYVGGKSIANIGGNLLDFLERNEVSKNAVLIEIKTPRTELLGTQYRGNVFNISRELSGAIIQVSNYKHSLQSEFVSLQYQGQFEFDSFEPACVVLAGNYLREVDNVPKRKSFELFRSHLINIFANYGGKTCTLTA